MRQPNLTQYLDTADSAAGTGLWRSYSSSLKMKYPVGLDVLIKTSVQLVITKLVFNYMIQPGILFNTQEDIEQHNAGLMDVTVQSLDVRITLTYCIGACGIVLGISACNKSASRTIRSRPGRVLMVHVQTGRALVVSMSSTEASPSGSSSSCT